MSTTPCDNDARSILQFDSDGFIHPLESDHCLKYVNVSDSFNCDPEGKGKSPIRPLCVELISSNDNELEHAFLANSPEASTSSSPSVSSTLSHFSSTPSIGTFPANSDYSAGAESCNRFAPNFCDNIDNGRGQGKDLPSLSSSSASNWSELDSTDLGYPMWSSPRSPVAGPSHQNSPTYTTTSPASSASNTSTDFPEDPFVLKRMPSRRRSLSNLSPFTTKSQSMLRAKMKWNLPRIQSNLSRVLLYSKQRAQAKEQGPTVDLIDPVVPLLDPSVLQYPNDALQKAHLDGLPGKSSDQLLVRTKARSKSLPQPLSALDYVPTSSLDIYEPIPLIIKNYFDDELPKELRLRIFKSLIDLHESDFQRLVASGKWSMAKASSSKGQWVGRERGMRELFKLSRVSKSWQRLVFDGQLWTSLDLQAFPALSESALLHLSESGCSFVRSLDLAGHVQLRSNVLMNITHHLCISSQIMTRTQLTSINLQGCSSLTTRSLHHLLVLSESLQTLNVKGLNAVTNVTCDILSAHCPLVTNLNMSRCPNIDAEGIQCMASAALLQGSHLKLKTLRVSGLKNISDGMMAVLGKATPFLEVLDLSYARQLHNSAIEAFVSCEPGEKIEDLGTRIISITAREAGRETGNRDRYIRRVTRLRHINLSYCILLTDMACSNLAYCVPRLEFFEMAGIGADLKDDGLIRLFRTTPYMRRIDLEDASDITDNVIGAITPAALTHPSRDPKANPQTGHALECLMISHANHVTEDALTTLIQNCPRLTCLEADNSRMNASVLREFVQLSRERNLSNAKIVAVDCRDISDSLIKELSNSIRPRMGWRAYAARKLAYLDARDDHVEELKVGQDECDEKRVVVKSFYTWQIVDSVRTAREKRRRSTKRVNSDGSDCEDSSWRTRWWSPSGRRLPNSGRNSPQSPSDSNDGCQVM